LELIKNQDTFGTMFIYWTYQKVKKEKKKKSMLINWKFEYNIQENTIPQKEGETISWLI
jgi:hypothetical protein